MLFDFLNLSGPLEEQANQFLDKARQNIQWSQDSIMKFLDYHKERVRCKELAAGTLKNYYRAAKLFCEMNANNVIYMLQFLLPIPHICPSKFCKEMNRFKRETQSK